MKNLSLFLAFFLPILVFGQVNENFSDGNFTQNPEWSGITGNFIINAGFELQSHAVTTSVSYLSTPSESFDDAVWECRVKITYSTSSSNYAMIYLASDMADLTAGNGYYVQVGGTNDEVSLFYQAGSKKTKIIDGTDKRTDGNPIELRIKVTRDAAGNFSLYSKKPEEANYTLEGSAQHITMKNCLYFGVLFSNTSTTGADYYFDDIVVTGNKGLDAEAPSWNALTICESNKLRLAFSEAMNFSHGVYLLDPSIGNPTDQKVSDDKTSVDLTFPENFERGKLYTLRISGVTDLAGNAPLQDAKSTGIIEPFTAGDLVLNEIMFENPLNSLEYVEICNTSDKVLDVSDFIFTTRKADGTLNAGVKVPQQTIMLPHDYLAICLHADSVRNYHHCPAESNLISTSTWSALNNESAMVVFATPGRDTICDEFTYSDTWHHVMIKNPKGVALERVNPLLPAQNRDSWSSAASETNYGTPGYKNSQYREITDATSAVKPVRLDPEAFSPDNDGVDDVCFIRYATGTNVYVANVMIFDRTGNRICKLASNVLLSSEGFIVWDGHTDAGKNANAGIYVLYFEMYNAGTGQRKQLKLPIVVTSR